MKNFKKNLRTKPVKINLPEVALNSPTTIENLPYPKVHYPNHYGIFISFSSYKEGVHHFCDCCKTSIDNYLIFHNLIDTNNFLKEDSNFDRSFSNLIAKRTRSRVPYDSVFKFKAGLCHKCNLAMPYLRWCHEMYGGNFKQYFGWYIEQAKYRLGFRGVEVLPNRCDSSVLEIIRSNSMSGATLINTDFDSEEFDEGVYHKVGKLLNEHAENVVRQEFGFCKIGNGWISERILFNVVKKIFPNEEVYMHARPQWLDGLEIDIFIPSRRLGFEYQGQQHFSEIQFGGGEQSLKELRKRDSLKRELCYRNDIILIEIDYTEPLTEKYILSKISAHDIKV